MDYEKKYNEALERAKSNYESSKTMGFIEIADTIVDIFPELAESEDERIRKWLYDYISNCPNNNFAFYGGVGKDAVLNYLEKQKDASKAIEAVDRIDKYIDEHLANAHDMKDSNPDKKYYRGWDDALGKMAGILQDVYSDEKQKEQKPADRFEEAREKYQVEWSEEDERSHKELIHYFESLSDCLATEERHAENRRWLSFLKSLRPSWKPSEEQMRGLAHAIDLDVYDAQRYKLDTLYYDLKKLI